MQTRKHGRLRFFLHSNPECMGCSHVFILASRFYLTRWQIPKIALGIKIKLLSFC
jgi:ferredoxin-like protein FixX